MLTAKQITENLHLFGDHVLHCFVYISHGIHDDGNNLVLQYACALLNSGGGVLQMNNVQHQSVQSKDLDMWWSGMECNFANILSGDDICNYFDFIGNFDDPQLYLFVKSAEHLCTLDYHCRLPTETATHDVSYRSVVKLLTRAGECGSLSDLPAIPSEYAFRRTEDQLKQEGKQIQFKHLTSQSLSSKSVPEKIQHTVTRYISAFANHEGGHIYFGIEDSKAMVMGEILSPRDQEKTARSVEKKMKSFIWCDTSQKVQRGKHWDIKFFLVKECWPERRVIVVVSVCRFPGGVFTSCPESFHVDSKGDVQAFTFQQWKDAHLAEIRDKPQLHARFFKVPVCSPQSRLVFGLPHTVQSIKNKVLKCMTGFSLQPKHVLDKIQNPAIKTSIKNILSTFSDEPHLAVDVHSFGIGLDLPSSVDSVLDVLVLSPHYGLHLITMTTKSSSDSSVLKHCCSVAKTIKMKLVHHGGCTERFGIHIHVVNINNSLALENFQLELDKTIFPVTYSNGEHILEKILSCLVVAVSAYKPHEAATKQEEYYFLLTCDQFELLWNYQFTKELWVHGPPGSGKTVSCLLMIKHLVQQGCRKQEVLYIAENDLLCAYIRSFDLCQVISRRELMTDAQDPSILQSKYEDVRNVFVDEAQNFKDRDGDWYSLANHLSNQKAENMSTSSSGYFWVFMDYAQKVHKFKAGLPGLIGKNNFMLSEISRNSKEIFEYASKFMQASDSKTPATQGNVCLTDVPKLGHDYSTGKDVSIIKCSQSAVKDTLIKVLEEFTSNGVKLQDMAILMGKKKDAETMHDMLITDLYKQDSTSTGKADVVTVDTVRRFSGLDRPVVIGLDPRINEEHADMDKFIVNLVTRAKDGLVIITTSDSLLKKLKD
ncbi:schlafen family member 13-like [Gigantopelta aegis]|uniref:schlafen family member 13-like n=1 Tax=Gigantopelta aegis TaxID=1735272 RepID=UPI001B8875E6|nr:schlafen family member 13-like [Gigantopelta aegis]